MPSLLNIRFGEYVLFRKIAKGGMAEVYLAGKKGPGSFDKLVALKTVIRQKHDDTGFIRLFYNEARLSARFNHPNIVAVHDVTLINGRPTMVMEYVAGATVADLVRKAAEKEEPFTRQVALRIALDSARGLYHAHHLADYDGTPLSLVHRDVSPQNILVGYGGQVKVFDFGIARIADTANGGESLAGVLAGKYAYMSPEQTQGGELDERSDVFSLGIILYELTTQRRLFKRNNQIEVLRAITEEEIPAPGTVVPGYPRALERIVMSALERDPAKRPATALELHDALAAYAAVAGEAMSMEAMGNYVGRLFAQEVKAEQQFLKEAFDTLRRVDLAELDELVESNEKPGTEPASPREPSGRQEAPKADRAAELRDLAARTVSSLSDQQGAHPSVSSLFPSVREDLYRDLKRTRRHNVALGIALLVVLAGSLAGFLSLMGRQSHPADPLLQLDGMGQAQVVTDPPGATLFVDGVQYAESSPATLAIPLEREVSIRAEREGYEVGSAVVTATASHPVHQLRFYLREGVEQEEQMGAIRVVTVPLEAAVFVNGVYHGLSPATIQNLRVGETHTLRVQNVGFETREVEFTLTSSRTREFELILTERLQLGTLSVVTDPPGATLRIDGELVGETPIERFPLVASRDFRLTLDLDGYRTYQTTVRVDPDSETRVDQRMVRLRDRPPGRTDDEEGPRTRPTPSAQPTREADEVPDEIRPVQDEEPAPEEDPYDLI
ncbi:MAG: serine/threonine protein kinase [Bradymonadales bacterium]|nr:serine/threonine protein kinase [Bradymonadales bacterium]